MDRTTRSANQRITVTRLAITYSPPCLLIEFIMAMMMPTSTTNHEEDDDTSSSSSSTQRVYHRKITFRESFISNLRTLNDTENGDDNEDHGSILLSSPPHDQNSQQYCQTTSPAAAFALASKLKEAYPEYLESVPMNELSHLIQCLIVHCNKHGRHSSRSTASTNGDRTHSNQEKKSHPPEEEDIDVSSSSVLVVTKKDVLIGSSVHVPNKNNTADTSHNIDSPEQQKRQHRNANHHTMLDADEQHKKNSDIDESGGENVKPRPCAELKYSMSESKSESAESAERAESDENDSKAGVHAARYGYGHGHAKPHLHHVKETESRRLQLPPPPQQQQQQQQQQLLYDDTTKIQSDENQHHDVDDQNHQHEEQKEDSSALAQKDEEVEMIDNSMIDSSDDSQHSDSNTHFSSVPSDIDSFGGGNSTSSPEEQEQPHIVTEQPGPEPGLLERTKPLEQLIAGVSSEEASVIVKSSSVLAVDTSDNSETSLSLLGAYSDGPEMAGPTSINGAGTRTAGQEENNSTTSQHSCASTNSSLLTKEQKQRGQAVEVMAREGASPSSSASSKANNGYQNLNTNVEVKNMIKNDAMPSLEGEGEIEVQLPIDTPQHSNDKTRQIEIINTEHMHDTEERPQQIVLTKDAVLNQVAPFIENDMLVISSDEDGSASMFTDDDDSSISSEIESCMDENVHVAEANSTGNDKKGAFPLIISDANEHHGDEGSRHTDTGDESIKSAISLDSKNNQVLLKVADDGTCQQEFNTNCESINTNDGDLNKVSDEELNAAKVRMDVHFKDGQIKPGDKNYEYDRRIEFDPESDSSWD